MSEAPEVDGYHVDVDPQRIIGNAAVQQTLDAEPPESRLYDCTAVDWLAFSESAGQPEKNLAEWLCPGHEADALYEAESAGKPPALAVGEGTTDQTDVGAAEQDVEWDEWTMLETLDLGTFTAEELANMDELDREAATEINERYMQAFEQARDLQRLRSMDENGFWEAYPDAAERFLGSGRTREEVLREYDEAQGIREDEERASTPSDRNE